MIFHSTVVQNQTCNYSNDPDESEITSEQLKIQLSKNVLLCALDLLEPELIQYRISDIMEHGMSHASYS